MIFTSFWNFKMLEINQKDRNWGKYNEISKFFINFWNLH